MAIYSRRVLSSDYYVVVVAGKYVSLAENGQGFTENEYDFAGMHAHSEFNPRLFTARLKACPWSKVFPQPVKSVPFPPMVFARYP
jgi:hypothetical protein